MICASFYIHPFILFMTGIDAKYPNWRQSFPGMILEPSPHFTSLIDPFTIATKCSQNIPICFDSKLFCSGEGAWVWQEQRISGLETRSIWGKFRKKWALNDSMHGQLIRDTTSRHILFKESEFFIIFDSSKIVVLECWPNASSINGMSCPFELRP